MSKIVIGKSDDKNVSLDLEVLLTTRLLVTADSGGGKTFALKRLCEQAFGKIQIIIVDPEGEFSPLRKKFDFVLAGPGGETPADIRSAAMLAQKLLEIRASAICDIYEMKPSVRHTWVRLFLDALIEAPKKLRHPCIVIVDEAHIFCPEHGKGESEAADAMKSLCTRGRKRLLCPIFATQRLATLAKDASSMLLNRLIGPTFEDINRKRAAECLSIAKEDTHDFLKQIQLLEPGNFYALGRAISREMKLVHIGEIETPHGQEAIQFETSPPPAPANVKALLPKLGDLPKEAEEKARTEAELRTEIRGLKAQLRSAPSVQIEKSVVDPKAIERAVQKFSAERDKERRESVHGLKLLARNIMTAKTSLAGAEHMIVEAIAELSKVSGVEIQKGDASHSQAPSVSGRSTTVPHQPRPIQHTEHTNGNGSLPEGEQTVLRAIAQYEEGVERDQLSILSGYKRSTRDAYIQRLRNRGYVQDNGRTINATQEGIEALGPSFEPLPVGADLQNYWLHKLPEGERKIFEILLQYPESSVEREYLTEQTGYKRSTRDAYLQRLISRKIVEQSNRGEVKAAVVLFE